MAMQLKSTHNVKNESVQGFGRMYPVDSLWNSEFDGCKMENIRKPLTLLQKRTCAAELRVVSRYPPPDQRRFRRVGRLPSGGSWTAERPCDTAETQMCIYDTIHMYVVRVKCGDVYIDIRTTILKIHMYHTCVCVWNMYLHTIPLFYTYVCFSYIVYFIYIYMRVCVNSWLCAPVIPMFVACNKKRLFWYIFWVCLKIKY